MRRLNKAYYFPSWDSKGGIVTSLWAGHQETTIQHLARTRDFSFSKMFRPDLRPIQPLIQVAPEVLCKQYHGHSMGLTTHLHLVQRLRMYEAVPLHPRYAFKTHRETTLSFCHSFSTLCYVNFNHHCPASYKTQSKLTTRLNTMSNIPFLLL